ncbi:MAG: hypothetical protein AB7I18_14775 [Candidatus Berkiella sp.]
MKANLKGQITSIDKLSGTATLSITSTGKVETSNIAAQETSLGGVLKLKSLVADKMKIGAILTITISDEEEEDRG